MSKEISLEEIKQFWPEKAPDIKNVSRYISRYVTRDIMTWKRDDMTIIKSKRFARLIQYLSKPKSGLGLGNQG